MDKGYSGQLDNVTLLDNYLIRNSTTDSTMDEAATRTTTETRSPVLIAADAVILVILILLTLAGNLVVIRAVLTYKKLKEHHSNWFIVNLAMADLLVNFVSVLSLVALCADSTQPIPVFGEVLCNIQCAMNYCLIVASMLTLAFISLDRLVHILYPLRYLDIISSKCITTMLIWPWVQGLCIGITPWAMHWIHYDYYELVCAIDWSRDHTLTYVAVAFITCFMIPLATLICSYSLIIREITKKRGVEKYYAAPRKTGAQKCSYSVHKFTDRSQRKQSVALQGGEGQHRKIIHSLLVVVGVFIICMTPFCVTKVIKVTGLGLPAWISTMATYVQFLASACNPFIYGLFRKEFRAAFRKQYGWLTRRSFSLSHRSTALRSVTMPDPSMARSSGSLSSENSRE